MPFHAALGALERQCAHLQFQEPQTKLRRFDSLVASILLYGIEIWGLSLNSTNIWKDLERPLVSMISHTIRNKALLFYDIIWVEMGAAPIIINALFQSVIGIPRLESSLKEEGTQGWHLVHQNNLLNKDTFIIGLLNCNNCSSHMHKFKCTPVPI